MTPPARRAARTALAMLAAVALAFATGELFVRALQAVGVAAPDAKAVAFPKVPHVAKTRPSRNPTLRWELDPADPEVNADGFRGRDGPADGEIVRIVALGDSVTYGRGLPLESSYAKQLERLLREDPGSARYEVLNFGVGGYNTRQELEWYRMRARSFEPDLVVIGFVLNDAAPSADQLAGVAKLRRRKLRAAADSGGPSRTPRELDGPPLPLRSALLALLRERVSKLFETRQVRRHPYLVRNFADPETWGAVRRSFASFAELSERDGVPIVVVIFPHFTDFENYAFAPIHAKVAAAARRSGLEVLDLLPHFREFDAERLRLSATDTVHPNALGHELAAQWIHEFIEQRGLLAGAACEAPGGRCEAGGAQRARDRQSG